MGSTASGVNSGTLAEAAPPCVAIVILTYNEVENTLRCLETVKDTDYENFRIIMVDNGSASEYRDQLVARAVGCELFLLDKNTGYAGGFNQAFERLTSSKDGLSVPQYILMLNNDLEITAETVSGLVSAIGKSKDIGFVGPETLKRDGSGDHDQWITRRVFAQNPASLVTLENGETNELGLIDVEFVVGHCLLFDVSLLRKVGCLREFFIYWEEIEWQWRASLQGWRSMVVPGCFAYHDRDTFGSPRNTFFRARNFTFFNRCVLSEDAGFGKQYVRNLVGEVVSNWRQIPHKPHGARHFLQLLWGLAQGIIKKVPSYKKLNF